MYIVTDKFIKIPPKDRLPSRPVVTEKFDIEALLTSQEMKGFR